MSQNAIITSTRNWLASWSTRLFLLAGAVAGVIACEEPKEIGLPPTTPVDVSYTDTITVTRETIRFDSVRSNDQGNLMVGRYVDPVFGKVQARAFFELSQYSTAGDFVVNDSATTNPTPANRIIYDSTRLFLDYDRFNSFYGDTTQAQELQLYRLTDSLITKANYDISSSVPAESQPLIRQVIRPRPTTTDSLSFRLALPDAIGRELMTLANTDAGKLANPALFKAKIQRGFLLTSTSNDRAAVLSFSRLSAVYVYFHVEGEKTTKIQAFLLNGKRFNQITADRNGTPLASLQRGQTLSSTAANGRTFVQPATGVTTKLTFPTLVNLVRSGRVAINRADLVITPANSNGATVYFPPYLALAEADEQNRLRRLPIGGFPFMVPSIGPETRLASSFFGAQLVARASRTNEYTFDMSGYLQSIVTNLSPNTGLALMTPSSSLFSVSQSTGQGVDNSQLYLTDRVWRMELNGNTSVKLIVFYTTSQ
ncbi:DUF4270 family protein [Spirosoma soli]|uniref:DUF4270 family protein n=2 Tax=Spirosoma soli TaxID=1770529 RepID=A0ABW5M1F0_9BACT